MDMGYISTVIVKDSSRLGRNYLEVGQYTDYYFPEHNIGIRIEDDLYLLKNKAINLSADIIKEVDEIEAFMAENK